MKTIQAAAYDTVHGYKGGATALGAVVDINGKVLSNKVNPNLDTHQLGLLEAVRIMGLSGDHQMLVAQCHQLGYLSPIPRLESTTTADDELLDLLATTFAEAGDVARELQKALADGRVTQAEFSAIEEQCVQAQSAFSVLLDRVRSLVVPDHARTTSRPLRQVR